MAAPFNPQDFIERLARRLVAEFDDASQAGTPGLVGSAREHPMRKQLGDLLPDAAGVGTGLIIDSYGGVSKQQDVVVYERAFCPIFSVNNTPEATYYPCEGTIAVGEIKSRMGSKELEDAFDKIASVKRLRRHAIEREGGLGQGNVVSYRTYSSPLSFEGTKDEEFSQRTKGKDQIYGFILCGAFDLKLQTLCSKAYDLWKLRDRSETPNLIVSLNDGFLQPFDKERNKLTLSAVEATSIAFVPEEKHGFGTILRLLNIMVRDGRTVDVGHYHRYFLPQSAAKSQVNFSLVGEL